MAKIFGTQSIYLINKEKTNRRVSKTTLQIVFLISGFGDADNGVSKQADTGIFSGTCEQTNEGRASAIDIVYCAVDGEGSG